MTLSLTRRRFLGATAALAAGGLVHPGLVRPGHAAAPRVLTATRRILEVGGRPASVYGLVGPDGAPGVVLDPGERFALSLANRCGDPTIVHWHGQTPPPAEDGVTDTGYVGPLADGGDRAYDFAARPGTHWMHSHHGLQEQVLMAAPFIVRTEEDLGLDAQEVTVLLHDFTFRDPAEVLAQLRGGMAMPMAGGAGMDHDAAPGSQDMAGMDHGAMGHGTMENGAMPGMDLNDIAFDAYLANDRTLDDPQVIRAERGGRVRLRLINGATATAFWIDLGRLTATVLAVDGNPVAPVSGSRFPLAQAQRLDLLVTLPEPGAYPVLAQREGDRQRTGVVLATPGAAVPRLGPLAEAPVGPVDMSLERRLRAATPLAARPADVVHRVVLAGTMMPYAWSIDGRLWPDRAPVTVAAGQRARLEFVNGSAMAHPMHLHGHHFQVVEIDGRAFSGALRDTVLVPPRGTVAVAFDCDNPGRWLLHCHNLYHMATGMMTEVIYAGA